MINHAVCNEVFTLLPQKALWWQAQKALILTDLHLGKGMHFRKAGIALPLHSQQDDFLLLDKLLQTEGLEQVIFLGDLFHSSYNSQWELLGQLINNYPRLNFILVQGNHDILSQNEYKRFGFTVVDILHIGPFLFSHEPVENPLAYNIYGHIHPGVRLKGAGGQSLRLPCFFFSTNYAVLPSFGKLTGLYSLRPKKTDKIFAIGEGKIFEMN
jgi:uncharacterized protein